MVGRWRVKPWQAMLVLSLAVNLPVVIVAFIEQLWLDQGGKIGLSHDYGWWIYQLTSVPATVFVFFWMPSGILAILEGLKRNKVIVPLESQDGPDGSFSEFITRFDRSYSQRAWAVLSLLGAIAFIVVLSSVHRTYSIWSTLNEFIFWYVQAFWFLLAFFVCLIVIRCLIAVVWFNRLFRELETNVRVLHPDGAGGLSPLGGLSVKIGYLIGIYGFTIVTATLTESYLLTGRFTGLSLNLPLAVIILVYLTVTPLAFFAPIGAAHSVMKTAKDEFLIRIADQFEADFSKMKTSLAADPQGLATSVEKIEQLQKLHRMCARFPVWPFNVQNIVRFLSSTIAPIVLALMSALVDLLVP